MTKKIIKKYKLEDGGEIKYIKDFINKKDAQKLFNDLKNNVPWTHGIYKMYGKEIKTPRLLYAMRDDNIDITKSYKVTGSMVWSKPMMKLRDNVEKLCNIKIQYAQLNYYRNGDDYIGYHTDSEMKEGDIIASISLGAERKFILRHKRYKTDNTIKINKHEFILNDGSLFIMNYNAGKEYWKHTLPKMKNVGPRINITFRPR